MHGDVEWSMLAKLGGRITPNEIQIALFRLEISHVIFLLIVLSIFFRKSIADLSMNEKRILPTRFYPTLKYFFSDEILRSVKDDCEVGVEQAFSIENPRA